MIYTAKIEVPNNASWQEIEDAKIKAEWKLQEKPKQTDNCRRSQNRPTLTINAGAAKSIVRSAIHHTALAKEESIYSGYREPARHVKTMKGMIRNGVRSDYL